MVQPRASGRPADGRRLEFLDALRGCAALGVVAYHLAFIASPPVPLPESIRLPVLFGGGGVVLFFVMSAFSLCLTMPGHERSRVPLASFYIKRLLRIAPLFLLVALYTADYAHANGAAWPTRRTWLLNVSFTFNLSPTRAEGLVFAGWTVGVEMLFYAVFPLLYRQLRSTPRQLAALLVSLAAYPVFLKLLAMSSLPPAVRDHYAMLSIVLYLPAFVIGMLNFQLWHRLGRRLVLGCGIAAIGVWLCVLLAHGRLENLFLYHGQWLAVCFGAVVLGTALAGLPRFVSRPLGAVGTISFSVYLLHGPVIARLHPFYGWLSGGRLVPLVHYGLAFAVTLGVLLPLSWISYRCIERPGIWLGQRLVRRLDGASLQATPRVLLGGAD